MATSWAKAVGDSLRDHYVRPKGRSAAQGEFLIRMNIEMQRRNPGAGPADTRSVEALRREIEPATVAEVRATYPDFAPERWSYWEPWETRGTVREGGTEVEAITFERNRGESRIRYRRLPPPNIAIAPGDMPPSWPLAECDSQDFTEFAPVVTQA